jgi:hypothetical protein
MPVGVYAALVTVVLLPTPATTAAQPSPAVSHTEQGSQHHSTDHAGVQLMNNSLHHTMTLP